jgi:hypothetical protein
MNPTHPTDVSRRNFLNASTAAMAAGTLAGTARASAADANSRIRIGFIGPGGRGFGAHVKKLAQLRAEGAKIDLVAVSEVYKKQEDLVQRRRC